MMLRDLAQGGEGISDGPDLKVRPLPTPGAGVVVDEGSGIIRGRAALWQGSYSAYNIGQETVAVSPTGATPRSDLIVLRVTDPEYEGGLDPAKDKINTFQVIPAVSPTATAPPSGITGIALARLDIPAKTGTITAGMITDVRRVANPRRARTLYTAFPNGSPSQLRQTDNKYADWPASARWMVPVPGWATTAIVVVTIAGLRIDGANAFGALQTVLGTHQGEDTLIDDDQKDVRRTTTVIADTIPVPAEYRGTTQPLFLQTQLNPKFTGYLQVDGGVSIVADVEFTEGPV
ncbi:hypothetical protein ACH4UT_23385 [Streptomyces sp. NPDC020799]|uniref:hypothetical protein n=1 Tax=Streptomyces sp. NPDC020799 TaxID=3365091 RepID=UPI0037B19422